MRFPVTIFAIALLAGCGRKSSQIAAAPPPWMEAKVEAQAKTGDPSAERVGDLMRGVAYKDGGTAEWLVHLDTEHCYWFSGAGDEGVQKLAIYLWDSQQTRAISDPFKSPAATEKGAGPLVLMRYCPKRSGPYRVLGKVGAGAGHIAFGIYAVSPEQKAAPVDLEALVQDQAASAAPGAAREGEFFTGAGDKSEWTVALSPGRCYWFIGVGEPNKVKRLEIYVWDPNQRRITESHNDNHIGVAGHCPTMPGMYKFQAKVQSGSGAYKVGIFGKPQ